MLLFYGALAPGTQRWMGYAEEELNAVDRLLEVLRQWSGFGTVDLVGAVSRHGLIEVILKTPFVLLDRQMRHLNPLAGEVAVGFESILATVLIVTIAFVWARELSEAVAGRDRAGDLVRTFSGSARWEEPSALAWVIALALGLTTMIWPYAYIGLETTQSAALLLAGYAALGAGRSASWSRTLVFAFAAAIAVSVKLAGFGLLPAVAYLGWRLLRSSGLSRWAVLSRGGVIAVVVLAARVVNSWFVAIYWKPGALEASLRESLVEGPFGYLHNVFSFLVAPNKGLLFFAPVAVLALVRLRHVEAEGREVGIFALLTLCGLAGGFSTVVWWSDETWGPRYLHAAVAPLVVTLAAVSRRRRPTLTRDAALGAAMAAGLAVSSLGSFVYYGTLLGTMTSARRNTLEAMQHDPRWNHVAFNAWVLRRWAADRWTGLERTRTFVVREHWWMTPPPGAPLQASADVGDQARPQPFLLRRWGTDAPGLKVVAPALLLALLAGLALLVLTCRQALAARE